MTALDVVVIGTGASGVSAAFPLANAGMNVLLIDPDVDEDVPSPPNMNYLDARRSGLDQWRWLLGTSPADDEGDAASSPKFRAPTLAGVFRGYKAAMRIESRTFTAIGSLAAGGLTAAWGAGVAAFSDTDLADFPIDAVDLAPHYRSVARRIGLSGGAVDDVSAHFGLDDLTDPPVTADRLGTHIAKRYAAKRKELHQIGFGMGRARLAVLTVDQDGRQACDGLGLCLWGCPRRSIYSAAYDLAALDRRTNVAHRRGIVVDSLVPADGGWLVRGTDRATGAPFSVGAHKVVLAAGVITTTALVMKLSGHRGRPVRLLSTPTAAFALFVPNLFGRRQEPGIGLAQHWYVLRDGGEEVCGGLFPTRGLPVAEFVSRAPLVRTAGLDVMRWVLPATTVGNLFFHARYSNHSVTLRDDDRLIIEGGFSPDFDHRLHRTARRLRQVFRRLGAFSLPGSFAIGAPGSDVHYAGTLPMRARPGPLETDACGALFGHPGLYVADASALSSLPAKSHTLTVMANAERIGYTVAAALRS